MTVFACIVSFILGWIAYKAADMYDRKREKELSEMTDEEMASNYAKLNARQYIHNDGIGFCTSEEEVKQAFLAGLKAGRPKWQKLDWEKDYPKLDSLVRVRTKSGEEYICNTYVYHPSEDEIGYGTILTQFEELNGDWVDDNEIEYWCYIEPFKEQIMFEKKAEEYGLENYRSYDDYPYVLTDEKAITKAFKDGAEFGYNKANEWHKYSERPKEKINALCFDRNQNRFILGFYDLEADEWIRYGGYETIHIDLWKEIALPKEGE